MRTATHLLDLLSRGAAVERQVEFVSPRGSSLTSFPALWALSSRAARAFETSVPVGRVAGILTSSAEMIACFVGALRAGRDFVSIPLPGRGQHPVAYARQLQAIATMSGATTLVVEAAHAATLAALPEPPSVPVSVAEALVVAAAGSTRDDAVPGELIQFSSGTTGTPKGVRLTGTAIGASVNAILRALEIGDRPETFCGWVPLSHDMGLIGGLLATWAASARTPYRYVCMSPELFVTRPSSWMETCAARGATITAAPTFAYQLASRYLAHAQPMDLSPLRAAIVGAEPIGVDTMEAFASAASRHGLRETAPCPAYGLAEATLAVSMVPPSARWTSRAISVDGKTRPYVSCGPVLDCLDVTAPGGSAEPGPILISGPAVCSGFIPARESTGPGTWLDTKDLGLLVGGELLITGRTDDLLCVAGRKLFAWELEHAANSVRDVRTGNCIVVADGGGCYLALFEPRSAAPDDLPAAVFEVRRALAAVAGIGPSAVGCLPRGALPKTPSGKLRRRHVAENVERFVSTCLAYRTF